MTKPSFAKSRGYASGNGTPFDNLQLAIIKQHERVHDGEHIEELAFAYSRRLPHGERYSWAYLLRTAERREAFNGKHAQFETAFADWPCTSADIQRVIAWRAASG